MQNPILDQADTAVLKALVTSLIREKPNDTVAFIYDYLCQKKAGVEKPTSITNIQIANIKNLRKKVEHLKSQLHDEHSHTESSDDDHSDEEVKAPARTNTSQRKGVSAEVYGVNNQKGTFVPKSVAKSQETKEKLRKRLMQAFMFNALDE